MSISTTYQCEAWLDEDEQISQSYPAEASFLIQIYFDVIQQDSLEEEEEGTITGSILNEFRVKRDYLLHDTTCWSTLSSIFTDMQIPFNAHSVLMSEITQCAQGCQDMDRNIIIPMVVQLRTVYVMSDSDHYTVFDSFLESFDSQKLMFVGASKSAIDALIKVKVEDFSSECVICLEDIPIGIEATCLPCKHMYHGSCISNWLQSSNCCPLCRSQIPS